MNTGQRALRHLSALLDDLQSFTETFEPGDWGDPQRFADATWRDASFAEQRLERILTAAVAVTETAKVFEVDGTRGLDPETSETAHAVALRAIEALGEALS